MTYLLPLLAASLEGDPYTKALLGLGFLAVASIVAWVLLEAGRG
jgi:hypothetical protein